jgi:hypothetical protein
VSIPDANTSGQQTGGYNPHLADLFRIRQMERLLKHALEELEQVKARLAHLEKEMVIQGPAVACVEKAVNTQQAGTASPMPPLPIAEIKKLAEMAKRFR